MDSGTVALIVTQSMTFLALVISETLPFTPAPYNGMMQFLLLLLDPKQKPS